MSHREVLFQYKNTLATRSANGFDAVFEVRSVNYAWSTRSCFPFCFFSPFSLTPLTAIKNSEVFADVATSVEVDVTGRCLLTPFNKTEWKYGAPFLIATNSRNVPASRTHEIRGVRETRPWMRSTGARRGCEQKYWGLFGVRTRLVYIGACLTYNKTCRQWLCCVLLWHLTRISEFQIAIYEYCQPGRPWWLT